MRSLFDQYEDLNVKVLSYVQSCTPCTQNPQARWSMACLATILTRACNPFAGEFH